MKVCALKRREHGAALPLALPVVEGTRLLELVVVEITEDGSRRPIRVARLMPIGEQRILAQLKMPALVRLRGWRLVISGIEEIRDNYSKVRGFAQTWLCELHPPPGAVGFRAKDMFASGERLPSGAIHQTGGTRGHLVVGSDHSNALQRHTAYAEVHRYEAATFPASRLIDCDLEFMSDAKFALGGMRVLEAHVDAPQRIERAGWLCEFDIPERELTKREARMLR